VSDAARSRPLCVKVCGLTRAEDVAAAIEAGADLVGFNFYPGSPRYVAPAEAAPLVRMLPRRVLAVGIFVNAEADEVRRAVETVGVGLLQFHGDEPPEFCRAFGLLAVKALRVTRLGDLVSAAAPYADGWLLADAADPRAYGGTGRSLALEPVPPVLARRLFVAGGLRPETVADVVRLVRPLGVDVCSGVERRPGIKDPEKLRRFVYNAKAA
jgi:phosphoribosylanthranilate isomerase